MKKKSVLISAMAIVILVAGGLGYRAWASSQAGDASEVQTTTLSRGSLESTLGSSGNTRSGQSATINWDTSGKVTEVTLEPGDVVVEDQVLAALNNMQGVNLDAPQVLHSLENYIPVNFTRVILDWCRQVLDMQRHGPGCSQRVNLLRCFHLASYLSIFLVE